MKTMIKIAGLLTVALFLAAGCALADGVQYTITSPDGTQVANFILPQSPTNIRADLLSCDSLPCTALGGTGSDFQISNIHGTIQNASGTYAEIFSLDFFNFDSGKSGLDVYAAPIDLACFMCFSGFEWGKAPLFTGDDHNPTLLTGTFNLTGYTVLATQVPEPSSLLLLGLGGIAVLALGLKRAA